MREGLFDDAGYDLSNIPHEMCDNCQNSEPRWDVFDRKYYKCLVNAKDIDECEFEEKGEQC